MTVEEFRDRLAEYADGELSPSETSRMDRKVEESPVCARLYEETMSLKDRLKNLPREEPSAEFEFALRSQILLEASRESRRGGRIRQLFFPSPVRAALTTAAAAVVALGAATLLRQAGPATTPFASGEAGPPGTSAAAAPSAYSSSAESVGRFERGALHTLSEEESIALSGRLYRNNVDSSTSTARPERSTRPAVPAGSRAGARRVMVSF